MFEFQNSSTLYQQFPYVHNISMK